MAHHPYSLIRPSSRKLGALLAALLLMACAVDDRGPTPPVGPEFPSADDYDYVSANPNGDAPSQPSYDTGYGPDVTADMGAAVDAGATADVGVGPGDPSDAPEVARGDIFRMLGDGLIANLNPYRGLQIIDVSNVDEPRIVGRLTVEGTGQELQLNGRRAFLLSQVPERQASDWDPRPAHTAGVWIGAVDLSDPAAPRLLDEVVVPGGFVTTRLVTGAGREALYLVTSGGRTDHWDGPSPQPVEDVGWSVDLGSTAPGGSYYSADVTSLVLDDGRLEVVSSLELGGSVQAVQATPEVLMVARTNPSDWQGEVQLYDIRDAGGVIVEGGSTTIAGYVTNLFGMDLYDGVLRVVSADGWVNTVETFEAADVGHLEFLDSAEFGEGEDLYATLFLGHKAFFVTFRQVDPFHAFEIQADGTVIEHAEFVISGWNDWFVPTFAGDRIVGVGTDQQDWNDVVAISLYDTTDLTNPEPLVERLHIGEDGSWSEASVDDRALTVLENAVAVEAPDGTLETGLVLVPFQAWSSDRGEMRSGVQMVSFSRETLTLRAALEEPEGAVRRSFEVAEATLANLSDAALRLFDSFDVDEPVERGHVELAPYVLDLLDVAGALARVVRVGDGLDPWDYRFDVGPSTRVDVLHAGADPDLDTAAAAVLVDRVVTWAATAGDRLLLALSPVYDGGERPTTPIEVIDVSDAANPQVLGRIELDLGYALGETYGCPGCDQPMEPIVTDDAFAFVSSRTEWVTSGTVETCSTWVDWERTGDCWGEPGCTFYEGYRDCWSVNGGPTTCEGEFLACEMGDCWDDCETTCEPIDASAVPTVTECYEHPYEEPRVSNDLLTIDLRAGEPSAHRTELPDQQLVSRVLPSERGLLYAFAEPVSVAGDTRSHQAWLVRDVDLGDPTAPQWGDRINVPGEPLALGPARLVSRDLAWADEGELESTVVVIDYDGTSATVFGRYPVGEGQVAAAAFDDAGRLVVNVQPGYCPGTFDCPGGRLVVLDAEQPDLPVLAELENADWAQLEGFTSDRAVFRLGAGVAVIDYMAPGDEVDAFFPLPPGSSTLRLDGDAILYAGGRYGARRFALE